MRKSLELLAGPLGELKAKVAILRDKHARGEVPLDRLRAAERALRSADHAAVAYAAAVKACEIACSSSDITH